MVLRCFTVITEYNAITNTVYIAILGIGNFESCGGTCTLVIYSRFPVIFNSVSLQVSTLSCVTLWSSDIAVFRYGIVEDQLLPLLDDKNENKAFGKYSVLQSWYFLLACSFLYVNKLYPVH